MLHKHAFRRAVVAALLLVAFLCQATWTLAGTTGGLSGQVTDEKGTPIAGATVTVAAPSQTASITTDAHGNYAFLSLAPDTYTLTASKSGYASTSLPGLTVFADQNQVVAVKLTKALKNIANVTAKAQGSLVKSGTTVDVYNVTPSEQKALATSGGGNNLDSAYSAIYSQPGVVGLPGNYGIGQVFYIHGSSYNQIGYEFDGVPVNRSFDNYGAASLSNLGNASIETYTGGAPANSNSPTLGGYINQVIKTGTFPGYANLSGGLGSPGYYHQAQVEAGGATPDRMFSWYVGVRGSDQIPNQFDSNNGGDLNADGSNQFGLTGLSWNTLALLPEYFGLGNGRGPWSTCVGGGAVAPSNGSPLSPLIASLYGKPGMTACNVYSPLAATGTFELRGNDLSDRENVINLHFGIPHRNDAGRDDVQVLFDNFFYQTSGWDNLSTFGGVPFFNNFLSSVGGPNGYGNWNTFLVNAFGAPHGSNFLGPAGMPQYAGWCDFYNFYDYVLGGASNPCPSTGYTPQPWRDAQQIVNAHFGQSALGSPNIVAPYYFPSSPTDRAFGSGTSPYLVSDTDNNGSIVKVQYTKNFNANSYLRVYGYTFYSDWLQTDPNSSVTPFEVGGATQGDYELNTHTRGIEAQYANQLNAQNLLTADFNYTTASVLRMNNSQYTFTAAGTPIATLMGPNGTCYAAYNNQQGNSYIDPGYAPTKAGQKQIMKGDPVSCLSPLAGAPVAAVQAGACTGSGGAPFSCLATGGGIPSDATWQLTQNLAQNANVNTVSPKFYTAALQDELRPTDRWDITAGVRLESYGYGLGNYSSPEQNFWFNEINKTVCVSPNGLVQAPQSDLDKGAPRYASTPGGYPSYITTAPGAACPFDPILNAQLYHPGQNGIPLINLGGAGTITNTTMSPRVGFTYTMSPNQVLRFSYGRYTQPTPTADEQVLTYLDGFQMANNLYDSQYYNNGYNSIVHDNPVQFSNNFDASYEQRLKNTDVSFSVSPYYRYTSNQSISVSLPGGLAGAFNSGTQKTEGVELAVQKGDPSRNGFSGQLSYTYTFSQLKYSLINGQNIITSMLQSLDTFTQLEKINGGSPCYQGGVGLKTCPAKGSAPASVIYNPYYNFKYTPAQLASQYPLTAFYPTYANFFGGIPGGDGSTALPPNVFAGYLNYTHNRWQFTLTGNLWEGTQYGSPNAIIGIDPRTCAFNQGQTGLVPGSTLADYQTCAGSVSIPNPATGTFDGVGQYRNPWDLNLGAQLGYNVSPRIHLTAQFANILNACFGGSSEPWTAAYPPNSIDCTYTPNGAYIGWAPNEKYSTAGAGYYYGTSPHSSVNGTAGYPKVLDQAYAPGPFQISSPFQMYFSAQIRL